MKLKLLFSLMLFAYFTAFSQLADTTADLDSGNAWLYNYSPDLKPIAPLNILATTSTANTDTPTLVENDSPKVLRVTRGTGANAGVSFALPFFNYTTSKLKFRVYVPNDPPNAANTRIRVQLRGANGSSKWLNLNSAILTPGEWNEAVYDLSAALPSGANTPEADDMYDTLLFFLPAVANNSANDIYFIDAVQFTAYTAIFNGTTTNYNLPSGWDIGAVPNSLYNVVIPTGIASNPVIISSATNNVNNLSIGDGSTLSIQSGGSLIVSGSYTGSGTGALRYLRTLDYKSGNDEGWHLISSPVEGQAFSDGILNAYDIAASNIKRGFATYDNTVASLNWDYFVDGESGTLGKGVGYSVKVDPDPASPAGQFVFAGAARTGDITDIALTKNVSGFNLIGNTFTSSINANTLLTKNSGLLISQTIWIWNQDTKMYNTYNQNANYKINPAQGFFVDASAGTSSFAITQSMLSHETDAFLKSASNSKNSSENAKITLTLNDNTNTNNLEIYYNSNSTLSFDNGYDSPMFGGLTLSLPLYSSLLENNNGMNLAIQSLPNSDYENMVIPVGVKLANGKEITFTTKAMNLPFGIKVFLEDRANNTFTELSNNGNYKVSTTEALDGVGRFYLHTKSSALSIDDNLLSTVSIYKTSNNTLRIAGLSQGEATIKLYNILGAEVMQSSFTAKNVQDISLPKLSTGIYIVQLENGTNKINKKIILE
jgi:hypothetical protein